MADALISPAVGGAFLAVSVGLIGYSSKKIKDDADNSVIPLMGVIGAFIFVAQMINFTIPMTGSSGHIGGGMLLAILLGPYAAFITIASVLIIQAFFFADGGLLALGCNIFNMGFFPCFICYPLIYRIITKAGVDSRRILIGSILATVVGLQLGAFFVVVETLLSGISELPFNTFLLLMQPIHLLIGIVEGAATSAVVLFIYKAQPELILDNKSPGLSYKRFIIAAVTVTVIIAVGVTRFASSLPDGLEWSIFKTAGVEELENPESELYSNLEKIRERTSIFPDYNFKEPEEVLDKDEEQENVSANVEKSSPINESMGTTVSGIVGAVIVLLFIISIGFFIRIIKRYL
ncbi:MAG: energy-coupling factor ABC transporter permease [Leptospirales bacterium]|nr:energy-coupling factor ABC transporter permease [Leptospirales bacterium]